MRILFSKCCMLFVIMLTLGLVPLVGNSSVVNATSYSDWDYSPVSINVYTVSGDVYNRVEPDSPISSEANFILTGSTNTVQIDLFMIYISHQIFIGLFNCITIIMRY